jgi:hypothetical protein
VIHYKIPGGATQKSVNRKEVKMENILKVIGLVVAALVLIVGFGLLLSLPVMLLWNLCLVPAIPGLVEIGWLQAWGIMILCGFLFKPLTHTKGN